MAVSRKPLVSAQLCKLMFSPKLGLRITELHCVSKNPTRDVEDQDGIISHKDEGKEAMFHLPGQ